MSGLKENKVSITYVLLNYSSKQLFIFYGQSKTCLNIFENSTFYYQIHHHMQVQQNQKTILMKKEHQKTKEHMHIIGHTNIQLCK